MQIDITGHNIEVSGALRAYFEKRARHVEKLSPTAAFASSCCFEHSQKHLSVRYSSVIGGKQLCL